MANGLVKASTTMLALMSTVILGRCVGQLACLTVARSVSIDVKDNIGCLLQYMLAVMARDEIPW